MFRLHYRRQVIDIEMKVGQARREGHLQTLSYSVETFPPACTTGLHPCLECGKGALRHRKLMSLHDCVGSSGGLHVRAVFFKALQVCEPGMVLCFCFLL